VVVTGEAMLRLLPDPIGDPLPQLPVYQFKIAPDPPLYDNTMFPASSAQKLFRSTDAAVGATGGWITVTVTLAHPDEEHGVDSQRA